MRYWIGFVLLLAGCSRSKPLEVYGHLPAFELTDQTGRTFRSSELAGKIWVADFIYTTCTGPCPLMTSRMHRVQGSAPEILYVSFSVDPEHDTPQVLEAYARQFHIQGGWLFLTGAKDTLQMLSRDAFKLSDLGLTHSTRFVLVDGKGRIRGYYGTSDDSPVSDLLADIRRLEKEPS